MLEKIKLDLRISHNEMDSDILDNIDAALSDMERAGIVNIENTDILTIRAVKHYCRWQYNFEGEADRYRKAYEDLVSVMSLHDRYRNV